MAGLEGVKKSHNANSRANQHGSSRQMGALAQCKAKSQSEALLCEQHHCGPVACEPLPWGTWTPTPPPLSSSASLVGDGELLARP